MNPPIYLDAAATNPVLPCAIEALLQCTKQDFGNPHARTHVFGSKASAWLQESRSQLATALGCDAEEFVFTSGGTESNNLAILGLGQFLIESGSTHILSSEIEHKAVLEPLNELSKLGIDVELIPAQANGSVNVDRLLDRVRNDTGLVSVIAVNNEIGSTQPIAEIADGLSGHSCYLHTDASQAIGKIPSLHLHKRLDLISISGHKFGGVPGSGGLIVKRRAFQRPPIKPILFGGGQERGLRGGTTSLPLAAALAAACTYCTKHHAIHLEEAQKWNCEFSSWVSSIGGKRTCPAESSSPWICSFYIPGESPEVTILKHKEDLALSSGAACTSFQVEESHVFSSLKEHFPECRGFVRASLPLGLPLRGADES